MTHHYITVRDPATRLWARRQIMYATAEACQHGSRAVAHKARSLLSDHRTRSFGYES